MFQISKIRKLLNSAYQCFNPFAWSRDKLSNYIWTGQYTSFLIYFECMIFYTFRELFTCVSNVHQGSSHQSQTVLGPGAMRGCLPKECLHVPIKYCFVESYKIAIDESFQIIFRTQILDFGKRCRWINVFPWQAFWCFQPIYLSCFDFCLAHIIVHNCDGKIKPKNGFYVFNESNLWDFQYQIHRDNAYAECFFAMVRLMIEQHMEHWRDLEQKLIDHSGLDNA